MNEASFQAMYHFQRIAKMPLGVAFLEARKQAQWCDSRAKVKGRWLKNGKQVVRLMRFGYRHLIVLRAGNRYVASYTWEGLIRKAANPYGWKSFDRTSVIKRRWENGNA